MSSTVTSDYPDIERNMAGEVVVRSHSALASALVAFQAEMPKVAKNKTANVPMKGGGSYRYTYADLPDVSDAAMPALTKHGLSFTCHPARCQDGSYELRGILRHTSGEYDTGALPLMGRAMQELGSAITYGRRYLLGCMTGIITDDDDDGSIAQAAKERTQSYRPPTPGETLLTELNALSDATAATVRANWPAGYGDPTTLTAEQCDAVREVVKVAQAANMDGA